MNEKRGKRPERAEVPTPEVAERGAGGKTLDRRLFMQLLAFTDCSDPSVLVEPMRQADVAGAIYADVNDPRGVALLAMSEDPAFFPGPWRQLLNAAPFDQLTPRPEMTMFGRTYSIGYEPDLEETLFDRPRRHALNPDWPWCVWYPLRRSGAFEQLDREERMSILREHGTIGRGFGEADFAHDVRLACHGLDRADNDFVIGLMGSQLHPLSALVQRMRSTTQTSQYLEHLGPFFVGRAVWQSDQG
ncbi:MAG: chlorite dismutase family protein [Phycisphaeraceae bacterium]|nr:chlorite dismutase family protein [Phycisphaeraceae bacterium]